MNITSRPDLNTISQLLADAIHCQLSAAIARTGTASIALSGGTSPAQTMQLLSQKPLDWSRVTITLSDERWLEPSNPRSNHRLIQDKMIINQAQSASFLPLYLSGATPSEGVAQLEQSMAPFQQQFDVCLLGMGTDGHFASLFPDSPQLEQGLTSQQSLIAVESPSVPEPRVSMTLSLITQADNIYLLIAGASKRTLLRQAVDQGSDSNLPIANLIEARSNLHLFEAES